MGREMTPTSPGYFTVLDAGIVMATDVPFDVAHEFVHTNCVLCASGEDHTNESVRRESA